MAEIYQDNSDSITITETLGNFSNLRVSDIVALVEESIRAVSLVLADTESVSEDLLKAIIPTELDDLLLAEVISKIAVAIAFGESQGISESETKDIVLVKADAVALVDTSQVYDVTQEAWWGMIKWQSSCHCGI